MMEELYPLEVFACIGEGVIITDLNGVITYINPVAEMVTEWSAPRAVGMDITKVFSVVDGTTGEAVKSPIDMVLEVGKAVELHNNIVLISKSGSKEFISAKCLPKRNSKQDIIGIIIIFRKTPQIKSTEGELHKELELLEFQFELNPLGMAVVDKNISIRRINSAFAKMMGYNPKQDSQPGLGAYELGCLEKPIRQVLQTGKPHDEIIQKALIIDGEAKELWYKVNLTLISVSGEKLVMVIIEDITELRQNKESVKNSNFLSVLDCLPAIAYWIGQDNQCKYINTQWIEFTGQPIEKGLHEGWLNFIHPEDINRLTAKHNEAVKEQIPYCMEMRLLHLSGDYRWILNLSKPYYNVDGNFDGYISLAFDITEQKNTEKKLERAKEAAENANRAKSEFLANMSHEIRTPLNGMVGMINLALISDIDNKLRDNLNMAKTSADSLLHVINDILDFSKIEAGKLIINNMNFNIYSLIEDVVKAHSVQANHRHLFLEYHVSPGLPTYFIGDPLRIKQILDNLLGNAIKFTERGGIVLSIKEYSRKNGIFELLFSVSDTGIGIDENEMDRLFKYFSQMNGSITRKYGGTGLGLAISRQLVEMMGGSIWVESKKGEGSTFNFTLPLMVGQAPDTKEPEQQLVKKKNIPLKILLVEDDEIHQNVFQQMLSKKGHTIKIASNGKEALDIIMKDKFDIILMDIKLPEIDGIDTTQFIRKMEDETKHIPIVAVTAYALKGDKERFLSLGMDEYIAKPVQMEELYSVLDRYARLIKEKEIINSLHIDENNYKPLKANDTHKIIEQHIRSMKEALENKELPVIEKEAHALKKFAASIHADELKRIAFTIELAARREDIKGIIDEIPRISDVLKSI